MTRDEFSNQFDTLLNSYASQALFGEQAAKSEIVLDEYEKSVILTNAQDIVVKSFFDRKKNSTNDGFDDTTERQIDFSSLIVSKVLQKSSSQSSKFDDRGIIYDMPLRGNSNNTDVLFILNEKLTTKAAGISKNYVVVPINYREYDREMSKPYAQPLKKQAWRLFQNPATGFDFKSELIPRWNLEDNETDLEYKIRYIRRPTPIVLIDLPDGLSVDGISEANDCELNPILHPEILQKAVELAAASRGISRPTQRVEQ
jgi:hypothetical protein